MVKYKVIVQPQANDDLTAIREFILNVYDSPATAKKVLSSLYSSMNSLDYFPQRFAEYPHKIDGRSIHVMTSSNYYIFYCVIENQREVHILSILHQHENVKNRLSTTSTNKYIKMSEDTVLPY